jgi:PAS domain S-box-containing protein
MRFGIQARLMLGITLVASLAVLIVGWYWTAQAEHEQIEALKQREERMAGLVARGFAAPLWNLDLTTLNNLLDAVMADPEVHTIQVQSADSDGPPLTRENPTPAVDPIRLGFEITHVEAGGPHVVGHAALEFSRALVLQQIAQMRRFVAGLLVAVLAAVLVTSYLMIRLLVERPVSRLGAMARRVAAGELGVGLPIERMDEIGALTLQFNAMSEQLHDSNQDLRSSEARYRGLFENAAEGIFQADSHGRVLRLNRALAHLLGFASPEQARSTSRRLRGLVQIEPSEYRRIVTALARHRVLQQVPLHVQARDGRGLWIELSANVVHSPDGRRLLVEGRVSDIGQRHQAEQELTQHRDHLEELVAERTRELSEAKKRAEAASRSKSRFLATMSHEFRTPLNAILGFAQLLQMDQMLSDPQRSKVNLIRDSGDHLLGLISDVLDMASIEAGKVRLQPVVLDLRALIEVAADAVRMRAEQKGLRFTVALEPALPQRVIADGQRLRQVLLNLLSNAVKFTDEGAVSLSVALLSTEPGQARLRFTVEDSGIGMDREQLDRLFQPFEQVAEDSRRNGGTGLGLSISQQLVWLMDGQIHVESELGKGSRFGFELTLPTLD